MARKVPIALGAVTCLLAAACGEDSGPTLETLSVTDSAGIEIVQIPLALYERETSVPVTTTRDVAIGSVAGAPTERFDRIGTVKWIDESRLVLANSGTQVRIYDRDGNHVRTFGRDGDGPGEFTRIVGALPTSVGDILAVDGLPRRYAVFDSLGGLGETGRFEDGVPISPDLVNDVTLAGLVRERVPVDGPQIDRRTDSIVTVSVSSGERLGAMPILGSDLWWSFHPQAGLPMVLGRTLSPSSYVSARAGAIVSGASHTYELRVFDESLTLRRVIRVAKPAAPVSSAIRNFHVQRWDSAGAPSWQRPEFADSVPHFRDIEVDLVGRIWVRLEHGAGEPDLRWDVFSPDGRSVQRVHLPENLDFRDANRTAWVGVREDALGVEYVDIGGFSDSLWNAP